MNKYQIAKEVIQELEKDTGAYSCAIKTIYVWLDARLDQQQAEPCRCVYPDKCFCEKPEQQAEDLKVAMCPQCFELMEDIKRLEEALKEQQAEPVDICEAPIELKYNMPKCNEGGCMECEYVKEDK